NLHLRILNSFPTRRSSDLAPDDQIFAHTGEMHSNHRETEEEFADKVAIADRIETVLAYPTKPELAGNQFAIKDDGGAGERAGAEDRKSTRLNSSHLGISYA